MVILLKALRRLLGVRDADAAVRPRERERERESLPPEEKAGAEAGAGAGAKAAEVFAVEARESDSCKSKPGSLELGLTSRKLLLGLPGLGPLKSNSVVFMVKLRLGPGGHGGLAASMLLAKS